MGIKALVRNVKKEGLTKTVRKGCERRRREREVRDLMRELKEIASRKGRSDIGNGP